MHSHEIPRELCNKLQRIVTERGYLTIRAVPIYDTTEDVYFTDDYGVTGDDVRHVIEQLIKEEE